VGNKNVVLDSNIVIDASKTSLILRYFVTLFKYLLVVTYTEVMGFNFIDAEKRQAIKLIGKISYCKEINKEIADITIRYRKRRKLSKLPDAFILATASYLSTDLITSNTDDFRNLR
jgi:predicted nucleic acid-binding protein